MNAKIKQLTGIGRELGDTVARLVLQISQSPKWDQQQAGWRHAPEQRDTMLFCVTKLAGSTSTANAMLSLSASGFWFQAAILARCIREANLTIVFMLPNPNIQDCQWPTATQKNELDSFFRETWADPKCPFDETSQRSQIGLKKLSAALGHFQGKTGEISQHDAGQVALQTMCFLSDYTHMAYPRLMELFEAKRNFVLSGTQNESAFDINQEASLIWECCNITSSVATLIAQCLRGAYDLAAQAEKPDTIDRIQRKLEAVSKIQEIVERLATTIENDFTVFAEPAQKLLRKMKQVQP